MSKSNTFVKILRGNVTILIECEENESILGAMIRQGIYLSADCGGQGTCGKCKVQIIEGSLDITNEDKQIFSDMDIKKGLRLSCKAYPKMDCTVRLDAGDETEFVAVADFQSKVRINSKNDFSNIKDQYVIGIDLGTTTLAFHLIDTTKNQIINTYTTMNKQRAFGADVISRIQASNAGKLDALRTSIRQDIQLGIQEMLKESMLDIFDITKVAIAGNTTMGHLLMGYSCESLGVFPFTPVNIDMTEMSFHEMFDTKEEVNIPVVLLPGISTFVGGDIVAGLLVCNFDKVEAPCILIDLGTNGEMAIGNKNKILVSSTAAGPAFEGGNISCGVGSIAGAICNVAIDGDKLQYKTIGDKPPVGICGTGVVEIISELLKEEIIDDTGLLNDSYFANGFEIVKQENAKDEIASSIVFKQKDIRELQMAKSAIRAGIETLIHKYGITYDQIETIYLAGGFGYKIDVKKAIHIGLLPDEFSGKIEAIGNSSLAGADQYLMDEKAKERIDKILSISDEIHLSNDQEFNNLYIEHMYFE